MWVFEQTVLGMLLVRAGAAQTAALRADGRLDVAQVVLIVASGLTALWAQKVRSSADRQREENTLRGIVQAPLACARQAARNGLILQVLGLFISIATARTEWHIAVAAYVAVYPLWRRLYRHYYPAVLATEEVS